MKIFLTILAMTFLMSCSPPPRSLTDEEIIAKCDRNVECLFKETQKRMLSEQGRDLDKEWRDRYYGKKEKSLFASIFASKWLWIGIAGFILLIYIGHKNKEGN